MNLSLHHILPTSLNLNNRQWYLSVIITEGQRVRWDRRYTCQGKPSFLWSPALLLFLLCLLCCGCHGDALLQCLLLLASVFSLLHPPPSVNRAKSLSLSSLLFVIISGTTVAIAALRRAGANSCVWARHQLIIHRFLWECSLLLRLATTFTMISKGIGNWQIFITLLSFTSTKKKMSSSAL